MWVITVVKNKINRTQEYDMQYYDMRYWVTKGSAWRFLMSHLEHQDFDHVEMHYYKNYIRTYKKKGSKTIIITYWLRKKRRAKWHTTQDKKTDTEESKFVRE